MFRNTSPILRGRLGNILGLIAEEQWNLLWVTDFPMFEWDAEEKRWNSIHHPFTAPTDEDLPLLFANDPAGLGKIRSKAYDMVLNGIELGGGSIRIHRADVQSRVFELLGISPDEARVKFDFLLKALQFRPAAARRPRLRPRPDRDAPDRSHLAPRRDRLPQDPARRGPHVGRARAGRRETTGGAVHQVGRAGEVRVAAGPRAAGASLHLDPRKRSRSQRQEADREDAEDREIGRQCRSATAR